MKRKLLLTIAAAFCGLGEPVAWAQAQSARPIYLLEEGKPNKERIEQFIKGGVELGERFYILRSDGLANHWAERFERGTEPAECGCASAARFTVHRDSIDFRCRFRCQTNPSLITGQKSEVVSEEDKNVSLKVLYISQSKMAARDQDGRRWLFYDCQAPEEQSEGLSRRCKYWQAEPSIFFLEIIPGNNDGIELIDAVRKRLEDWHQPYVCRGTGTDETCVAHVFEGPQAKRPRFKSEVFFTSDEEDAQRRAVEVASYLEPVIGAVTPIRWPGPWDFEVVVVVGKEGPGAKGNGKPPDSQSAAPSGVPPSRAP